MVAEKIYEHFDNVLMMICNKDDSIDYKLKRSVALYRKYTEDLTSTYFFDCNGCNSPNCCVGPIQLLDIEYYYLLKKIGVDRIRCMIRVLSFDDYGNEICPFFENDECTIYKIRPSVCIRFCPVDTYRCAIGDIEALNWNLIGYGRDLRDIFVNNMNSIGVYPEFVDFIDEIYSLTK